MGYLASILAIGYLNIGLYTLVHICELVETKSEKLDLETRLLTIVFWPIAIIFILNLNTRR